MRRRKRKRLKESLADEVNLSRESDELLREFIDILNDVAYEGDDSLFEFLAHLDTKHNLFNRSLGDIASIIKNEL